MGDETFEEPEMEVLPSMWPDDIGDEARKQFNIDKPGTDQDMLEDVKIEEDPSMVDFKRLAELTNYSEKGSSQLTYLVKTWEYKQANVVRLLNEELNILNQQREEAELKKLEILEEYRFEEEKHVGDKRSISILDDVFELWETVPRRRNDVFPDQKKIDIDAEYDTIKYWKQRAMILDKMLEASIQREQALMQKLQKNIKNIETESSPVEELSQILKRADNFLHFILQNAPVVIGHQDKDLRYRFIYNHFPRLGEEEIIGKTDTEIFSGAGVKEIQEFKKDVLERGSSAKREITFETPLFGLKTFLIYVEPVFSKAGETIGINYMGMDVTDQVNKRERMTVLREEIAVRKAKETELNKTIHITEETMRAKQMLATMSHEIRSPLTGVVSMAEILANTKMDKEQRQLLDVMMSSGDLVLQLINDILDLSKVESGVMKLEAAKFRPREVVKHVLQTAAAALQKELTLEGQIDDNVPIEVIGDVLRIRQILTNLISNAIKFTHEGKVGINLQVVSEQCAGHGGNQDQVPAVESSAFPSTGLSEENGVETQSYDDDNPQSCEKTVFLRCDVYDTGIGIPEKALPSLFKKYMQVSTDHARKYGGTGLGLAICKQLVELMGGQLTVTSQEKRGSTFTFILPCKIPSKMEFSDDQDDESGISDHEVLADASTEEINGSFIFKPRTLGTLFSSGVSVARKTKVFGTNMFNPLHTPNGLRLEDDLYSFNDCISRDCALVEDVSSVPDNTYACNGIKDPQRNVNSNVFDTVNRNRELEYDTNGCLPNTSNSSGMDDKQDEDCTSSGNSTTNHTKLNNGAESRNCNVPCHSQSHENRSLKIQSTRNESSGTDKINLQPKILLVEDNKINIMVAQSMMKQLGHQIDVVRNGLEAIHALQRSHFDLILMDVCMPVMDGLQATRLIRSFEEHGYWDESVRAEADHAMPQLCSPSGGPDAGQQKKRIPIVAMTANALSESADECLANGMDTFVSKPVTFQKLKQCLHQYFPC